MQALSRELDHATRATQQLLVLARADAGRLVREPFDLGELAREVALALLPQARAAGLESLAVLIARAAEQPVGLRLDAPLALWQPAGEK